MPSHMKARAEHVRATLESRPGNQIQEQHLGVSETPNGLLCQSAVKKPINAKPEGPSFSFIASRGMVGHGEDFRLSIDT